MQVGNFQASFTTLCPSSFLPEPALQEVERKSSPWLAQVQTGLCFLLASFLSLLGAASSSAVAF